MKEKNKFYLDNSIDNIVKNNILTKSNELRFSSSNQSLSNTINIKENEKK